MPGANTELADKSPGARTQFLVSLVPGICQALLYYCKLPARPETGALVQMPFENVAIILLYNEPGLIGNIHCINSLLATGQDTTATR